MAKKFEWNSLYSKDNLLARFLSLFYVIPPVVNETPGARQRSLLMRFKLPVFRTQRFSGRTRDLYANKESASERADCSCCCCNCDCCQQKRAREWLLPRAADSCLPLKPPTELSHKQLQLIRDPGDCVLGVLTCGYVLSGSGSVKGRFQKRA
jgi:hypothetical protein